MIFLEKTSFFSDSHFLQFQKLIKKILFLNKLLCASLLTNRSDWFQNILNIFNCSKINSAWLKNFLRISHLVKLTFKIKQKTDWILREPISEKVLLLTCVLWRPLDAKSRDLVFVTVADKEDLICQHDLKAYCSPIVRVTISYKIVV